QSVDDATGRKLVDSERRPAPRSSTRQRLGPSTCCGPRDSVSVEREVQHRWEVRPTRLKKLVVDAMVSLDFNDGLIHLQEVNWPWQTITRHMLSTSWRNSWSAPTRLI